MSLLVSLKDKVARNHRDPDLANAFRQIENWCNNTLRNAFFVVSQIAPQSVPNNGAVIVFGSVINDTDHAYNKTTGVYTIPKGQGGFWLFTAGIQWAANAAGSRQLYFRTSRYGDFNDTTVISAAGDNFGRNSIAIGLYCVPGDTVAVFGFQNSGGALNTGGTGTFFMGGRVCPSPF